MPPLVSRRQWTVVAATERRCKFALSRTSSRHHSQEQAPGLCPVCRGNVHAYVENDQQCPKSSSSIVVIYSTGHILPNCPASFRQRDAQDLGCPCPPQTPLVAPYYLRIDFSNRHLSPAHSHPYFLVYPGLLLSILSMLHLLMTSVPACRIPFSGPCRDKP